MTFMDDRTWRVCLVVEVPSVAGRTAAVGRAARALEAIRGETAGDGSQLTVAVTVDAADALEATAVAANEVLTALARAGAPGAEVVDHFADEYIELVGLDALIAQL